MTKRLLLVLSLTTLAMTAGASNFNILWYDGGVVAPGGHFGSYANEVAALVAAAPTAPGNNTWNVTFWSGGAMPSGTYNALVVVSPQGFWSNYPNFTALDTSSLVGSFDPTTTRIMLSGQDADYHLQYGAPAGTTFDGPRGFLLDGINWAASGTGMGLVTLGDDSQGALLVKDADGFAYTGGSTNDVRIPAAMASFPINTGLTSAGLSNWGTSAHDTFGITDSTKWTGINTNGASTTSFVTIVSSPEAAGSISGVPEPTSVLLFGVVAALVGNKLRHRLATQA